jgi:neprosin-like protein
MAAPSQNPLNPEISQWLEARQSALKIVKTTTTPGGQTLDWIPYDSQDPAGIAAYPPPLPSLPVRAEEKLKQVTAAGFELDDLSVERGPAGTVPIVRPDFSHLTKTIALKGYATKRGGLLVNKNRPNRNPGDPNPFGYFHAMSSQNAKVYGCDGFLSVWDPTIDNPQGAGDDHSIMQTWLQNYDKGLQSVEAGWTVDKSLNGDAAAHLFLYYTTNAYAKDGNNLGGYNRRYSGWVQYSPTVFPGARIIGVSTQGGQQFDISIKFQLFQNRWWFGAQGVWMGYYPATLFNGGLGNYAEWVGFGGEVESTLANPALTKDQMGSGRHAQDGWTFAAFQRNLRNQVDPNGSMVNNDGAAETDTANGGVNPYTIQMNMNSATSWGSYFYVGGPSV